MTWNNPVITGSRSVSQNKIPLDQNADYTELIMRRDHFWDDNNSNFDGRHQWVQMPKLDSPPFVLSISDGMDGGFFVEEFEKEDSTEENIPKFKNSDGHEYMLGVRAAVNFTMSTLPQPKIEYEYNVKEVTSQGDGLYTISFRNPMPTNNYIVNVTPYRDNFTVATIRQNNEGNYGVEVNKDYVRITSYDPRDAKQKHVIRCMVSIVGG